MNRPSPDLALRVLGQALEALRRDRGLSQAEAGARLNMTSQGWGFYESGRRPGLYRPDKQAWLTAALDATPEDLALVHARLISPEPSRPVSGFETRARVWRGASGADNGPIEMMVLSDDDLSPWGGRGVTVEFVAERWPRAGQGCVIDLKSGDRLVRIYENADSTHLWLRGGSRGLDERTSLPRAKALRVSAITTRREPE